MAKTVSLDEVRGLIIKVRPDEQRKQIAPNADLFDEGFLDSFSVLQLVQAIENEYGIVFAYEDLRRDYFSTAEALHGVLTKKYGIKAA